MPKADAKDSKVMGKTSREKGKRGERELAGIFRSYGYDCHRGVQYHGGPDSPDVIGLPGIHVECKRVERLNMKDAIEQSVSDAGEDLATVFHRRNGEKWNVTMPMEDWMVIYCLAQEFVKQVDPGAERSLRDVFSGV